MIRVFMLAVCCLLAAVFTGCSTVEEGAKGFAGLSTKALEEGRKEAVAKTFNYGYDACFVKASKILKNIGTYIYAQDRKKGMIAVYITEEDTTPVGVFLKVVDAQTTQVEVSSRSAYGKELISKRLFQILEYSLKDEKEEETDAKKDTQDK